jgi:hypothetical protein
MVLTKVRIKPCSRSKVTGLGNEAEGSKCPQNPVDRHPGDLWDFAPHCPVNLLGGRMVLASQNRFKHGTPLDGDGQAALAMGGNELV